VRTIIRFSAAVALATVASTACSDQNPAGTSAADAGPNAYTAPAEPVNGEFIRQSGTDPVYLVYNRTLYGIPDMQTLRACTGGREKVVRAVPSLPVWTQRALPSAGNPQSLTRPNNWMFGDHPIQSDAGGAVYVLVGCIRSGIDSPETYQAIFGHQDWSKVIKVPASTFAQIPEGPLAQRTPLRRAGTLISGAWVKWVTYHGGALGVPNPETMDSYCRGWSEMVSSTTEHAAYAEQYTLQMGPGFGAGCLRGNDYPYPGYSMGAVDPWNYYYRNCTSFAAWRLNQDGIKFHNQFGGYHWSDASTWDEAARWVQQYKPELGVRINKTPAVGAIAQWNSNHVAYVAAVTTKGTVILEDYNGGYPTNPGTYNWRERAVSEVENFIHFR
jgi:surface antigen